VGKLETPAWELTSALELPSVGGGGAVSWVLKSGYGSPGGTELDTAVAGCWRHFFLTGGIMAKAVPEAPFPSSRRQSQVVNTFQDCTPVLPALGGYV